MRLYSPQTLFLALIYSLHIAWAQSLIPPSSLPDVPSSTSMTSTTSSSSPGASASTTNSSTSSRASTGSGSASSSLSATTTTSAQFPSLSGVSDCVSTCLATSVADAHCDDLVGVDCWCPNDRFPLTYFNCIADGCSSDLATAENLVEQFCKQSNTTLSATSISFPSFTMTSTSQSTPTLPSGTSSNGNPPATTSSSAAASTRLNADGYIGMETFLVWIMIAVGSGFMVR